MWELDYKESWALKNWCLWTVELEKTLRVPWIARRSNQSILKEISPEYSWKNWCWSWSSSTLATWLMSQLIRKDPEAGKDWRREEKGTTEDEVVGWHHQLDGHEFEQAPGVGDGQGNLACCNPWGHNEPDMTEWLNWTEHTYSNFQISKNWNIFIIL